MFHSQTISCCVIEYTTQTLGGHKIHIKENIKQSYGASEILHRGVQALSKLAHQANEEVK